MSWYCQGIVVKADELRVRDVFESLHPSKPMRLCCLADCVYGVFPTIYRGDYEEMGRFAMLFSERFGSVLWCQTNNHTGDDIQLFEDGRMVRQFGEADALCAPADDEGEPIPGARQYYGRQLQQMLERGELSDDMEFAYVLEPVEVALRVLGVPNSVTAETLWDAFDGDTQWIAEHQPDS